METKKQTLLEIFEYFSKIPFDFAPFSEDNEICEYVPELKTSKELTQYYQKLCEEFKPNVLLFREDCECDKLSVPHTKFRRSLAICNCN